MQIKIQSVNISTNAFTLLAGARYVCNKVVGKSKRVRLIRVGGCDKCAGCVVTCIDCDDDGSNVCIDFMHGSFLRKWWLLYEFTLHSRDSLEVTEDIWKGGGKILNSFIKEFPKSEHLIMYDSWVTDYIELEKHGRRRQWIGDVSSQTDLLQALVCEIRGLGIRYCPNERTEQMDVR